MLPHSSTGSQTLCGGTASLHCGQIFNAGAIKKSWLLRIPCLDGDLRLFGTATNPLSKSDPVSAFSQAKSSIIRIAWAIQERVGSGTIVCAKSPERQPRRERLKASREILITPRATACPGEAANSADPAVTIVDHASIWPPPRHDYCCRLKTAKSLSVRSCGSRRIPQILLGQCVRVFTPRAAHSCRCMSLYVM